MVNIMYQLIYLVFPDHDLINYYLRDILYLTEGHWDLKLIFFSSI